MRHYNIYIKIKLSEYNSYKINITKHFVRQLKRLNKEEQEKVRESIRNDIIHDPHSGKFLKGEFAGCYRYRIGNIRIIYQINEANKVITFLQVGPRKNVYK